MNPDDFRVQVYGARWYHDPLPACSLAEATSDRWPAVSTVKKAWSKPYRKKLPSGEVVPLDAFWAASYAVEHRDEIVALEPEAMLQTIALASGRTLNRAAERGTDIHKVIEDLVAGQIVDPMFLSEEARPYFGACDKFVADCKPTPIVTEVVAINRTLGFGGTLDAIVELDGVRYLVDWKTRSSAHGAYEEEAAQLGGYRLAEYIINGDGVRAELPDIERGLIVSFTTDSYELYPVDLTAAVEAFKALLACWQLRRSGTKAARAAIGTPLANQAVKERAEWLAARAAALRTSHPEAFAELAANWPDGVPTFKQGGHTGEQVEMIALAISAVEAKHQVPFGEAIDPNRGRVDADVVVGLVERLRALPVDLLNALDEARKAAGIPDIESHRFTAGHLGDLEQLLADAEAAAEQRTPEGVQDASTTNEGAAA